MSLSAGGCNSSVSKRVRVVDLPEPPDLLRGTAVRRLSGAVSEVASPAIFLDLNQLMAEAQPQVAIASPKANQVLEASQAEVRLTLKDLSIYKDETLGLGPHIQVFLDNQPARSVYSLDEALIFADLAPGSHTLRAIAVRPWGESFKNDGAYAQLTFHVLAATGENAPDSDRPLLTYLEPQGTYGAEPVLLDFYLDNAPLRAITQDLLDQGSIDQNGIQTDTLKRDRTGDWRIRAAVNGQRFVLDQWQPLHLKGLTPGQNWVQLTLIDTEGNPIENAFNSTVRTFTYDPKQQDTLAKIVRGELSLAQIGQIAVPGYVPPVAPPVESTVEEFTTEEPNAKTEIEPLLPADQRLDEAEEEPETEILKTESSETETSEVESSSFAQDEPEIEPKIAPEIAPESEKTLQENIGLDDERSQAKDITADGLERFETEPFEIDSAGIKAPNIEESDVEKPDNKPPLTTFEPAAQGI